MNRVIFIKRNIMIMIFHVCIEWNEIQTIIFTDVYYRVFQRDMSCIATQYKY